MGFSCHVVFLYVLLIFSSFYFEFLTALDTITKSQFIKDPETITSGNSNLKLGFFSPRNSSNRYVGIWYLSESNIIWVANREQPLRDSLGIVTISKDGNLVVMNGEKQVIWSSNLSNFVSNSSAKLLDTGNLVLLDDSAGNTLWESFQHPTDSFMPKMKLSTNIVTGKKVKLTSWKSPSDPSTGNFSVTVERLSIPEVFIWNKTKPHCRTGPWNGWVYLGEPNAKPKYQYDTSFGREDDGTVYVTASSPNGTFDFVFNFLNSQGKLGEKVWKNKKELVINSTFPGNDCDIYGFCGSFGTCNVLSSPICSCLKGFKPNNTEEWSRQSWQSGCVRRVPLQCDRIKNGSEAGKSDGFLKLETAKVPDFAEQSYVSEDTCRSQCLQNCSCTAYAYDAGIGCMSWNGRLIDIRRFTEGGVDLYIKVDYSELDKKRSMTVIIAVSIIVGILIAATCSYFLWTRALKHSAGRKFIEHEIQRMTADAKHDKLEELPLFDFKKAWKLWNEEDIKALIDPAIFDPVFENQILRYIHIGLLCVQELASERPSMTTVVLMLNSEIVNLPPPGQVAFAQRRNLLSLENRQEDQKPNSANNIPLQNETITSGNSNLKLGFISPRNSSNRYVGIWYLSESNIIWVANREQPLRDSLGIITISKDGNLVVMNGKKQVIWSSNLSNFVSNSSAKLLDTGNLVLLDDSTGNTLWESFQHPTDSFMPKMKLSTNIITGKKVKLTSWKSPSDPSTGNFSVTLERLSIPNCSCTAYAYDAGIGCMSWNGRLIDVQRFMEGGVNLYIKVDYSELDKKRSMTVIIAVSIIVGILIAATCSYFLWTRALKHSAGRKFIEHEIQRMTADAKHDKLEELPLFDFKKAWKLWNEEDIKDLIDPEILDPESENQIVRCLHIGLLCAQELASERPNSAYSVTLSEVHGR
ncbi:hypothetical protein L6164_036526 [Bauhinia variegata]|uniref:Uncharacterized protein n=1 Tax=Bauhinia variegata TaxID=167791 RepID=A0ACB9KI32_BAUVA|nr:hypothetical protein L6164_036526 [Bauhinia variegata]